MASWALSLGTFWGLEVFTTRLFGDGRVVADKIFISIPKQIDFVIPKGTKIEVIQSFQHGSETTNFVFERFTQAGARGCEIIKQAFDVFFRSVTHSRAFYRSVYSLQVYVEVLVVIRSGDYVLKDLTEVDKVSLCLNRIILKFVCDDFVSKFSVDDAFVSTFDVLRIDFAYKSIEECAKHVLLKVPAIHSAAYIVGELSDASFKFIELLGVCYRVSLVFIR